MNVPHSSLYPIKNISLIHGDVNRSTLRKKIKEPGSKGSFSEEGEEGRGEKKSSRSAIVLDLKIPKQDFDELSRVVAGDRRSWGRAPAFSISGVF